MVWLNGRARKKKESLTYEGAHVVVNLKPTNLFREKPRLALYTIPDERPIFKKAKTQSISALHVALHPPFI